MLVPSWARHTCVSARLKAWALLPAGLRAAVEPAREGDPQQPRLQPEPALPLEVPLHGQGAPSTDQSSQLLGLAAQRLC